MEFVIRFKHFNHISEGICLPYNFLRGTEFLGIVKHKAYSTNFEE